MPTARRRTTSTTPFFAAFSSQRPDGPLGRLRRPVPHEHQGQDQGAVDQSAAGKISAQQLP